MLQYLRAHPVLMISIAQLFATSLWFSANSAGFDLIREWQIDISDIGLLTNAVQAGFILGTFLIAFSGVADRYQASLIFSCSALFGSIFNLCFAWLSQNIMEALFFRLLVGISLAGIYPIGMKLIIEWAPHKAGQALSQLVAMLTLGTALPYALNSISTDLSWQYIISISSILAIIAAICIFYLGDKQNLKVRQKCRKSSLVSPFSAFKIPRFKAAAVGYFGHMWELYTFWTLVPLLIVKTNIDTSFTMIHSSLLAFFIIAVGAIGCIFGGIFSRYVSNRVVALVALASSGLCCLFFVLGWDIIPTWLLLIILIIWGMTVVADSPQFSALSAQACSIEQLGGALALQNSFGFFLTIISIAITTMAFDQLGINALWIMLIGPVLGILGYIKFDHVKT
ncbi:MULTISPECIES: MFS transporter [unclassified Acinetobacter]|uniref:MFS transporter n=1 Tax=unclassified Acinetobacter TaxID=196816 RepID=UPI0029348AF5|nr:MULTISPECIES: MFS transporter [unclassified Acinetobacter]WOE30688.1 MFS transporter [Acinetobacter sp. SAAs470]WOE38881.1 MFS transporter [Acinetobacter sp. SAAs474]